MKKLFLILSVLGLFAGVAQAASVTNPLYMPEEGNFLIDLDGAFKNDSGKHNESYLYKTALSYNTSDRLQLGAYIGYANLKKETPARKDFTNPGAFAYFRIFDNIVKLDLGGEGEFNVFDSVKEGGVSDGANKFTGVLRTGADLKVVSFGAEGRFAYWDTDKSAGYIYSDMVNAEAKGFFIFDILDMLGIGAEGGYRVYNVRRDDDWHSKYITARLDINPLPSRLGFLVYATAEDNQNRPHTDFTAGLKAKLRI